MSRSFIIDNISGSNVQRPFSNGPYLPFLLATPGIITIARDVNYIVKKE